MPPWGGVTGCSKVNKLPTDLKNCTRVERERGTGGEGEGHREGVGEFGSLEFMENISKLMAL